MEIAIAGPGRAGMALGLALDRSDHRVVAVVGRDPTATRTAAQRLGAEAVALGDPIPDVEVLFVAVRDDAIETVAERLAAAGLAPRVAAHLSGLRTLDALASLRRDGTALGSFHPLQSLPDPDVGAARLPGAWVAISAEDEGTRRLLRELAVTLGMTPFDLAEGSRALYHAAAVAAANVPLAALAMAEDLFEAAGVPFEVAEPLVHTVMDNAFAMGPRMALTGPVARGDEATVAAQVDAVSAAAPDWLEHFEAFVAAVRHAAGRSA